MRTEILACMSALLLTAPGCQIVLDLPALQGGDAGTGVDAPGLDAPELDAPGLDAPDAGRDAPELDAPMLDAPMLDAPMLDAPMPDGGADAPGSVSVGGTIVGLPAGSTLTLENGSDTVDVAGGGTSFSFLVPRGAAYDVTIASEPTGLLCVVYRGAGTAMAAVDDVFVGCSTSMGLVSFFPFDGSVAAARGRDWTSLTGAGAFTTDRMGRAGMALDAQTGPSIEARLDQPLDGRPGSVATGATQFTVSLWARLPSGGPTSGSIDLIGHYSFETGSAGPSAQIAFNAGVPRFQLNFYWDGGFSQAITPTTTDLPRAEWRHVTIAASGPDVFERAIYVDGVREGITNTCCGWGNASRYWAIVGSPAQRDELRIYSRRLSDAEIAGIYAAENVP